jgi:hypothetical protein
MRRWPLRDASKSSPVSGRVLLGSGTPSIGRQASFPEDVAAEELSLEDLLKEARDFVDLVELAATERQEVGHVG